MRRSARSAMPTLQVYPSPSARALAYDTTTPETRQYSATPARGSWPSRYSPIISPAKIAASATRSMVESRKAPNLEILPVTRATAPSSMSNSTNAVMTIVPQKNSPRVNRTSAPAATPTVPMTVIALGETPVRATACPTGVRTRPSAGLILLSIAVRSLSLRRPVTGRAHRSAAGARTRPRRVWDGGRPDRSRLNAVPPLWSRPYRARVVVRV